MMKVNRILFVIMVVLCAGCVEILTQTKQAGTFPLKSAEKQQAEETRLVNAPYDQVYQTAIGAMETLQYSVRHADKKGGLITDGSITILMSPSGKRKTTVRIKTCSDPAGSSCQEQIDNVWKIIERETGCITQEE